MNKALIELTPYKDTRMDGQVHDEIICETREDLAPVVVERVTNALKANVGGVEITADAEIKTNWGGK